MDLRPLGERVAEALDGRGGGSPEMVQGKVGSLEGRDRAIALLREALTR